MRKKKTIINASAGIISQIILLILGFITRKIFINNIGVEYLGINGLFSNILALLNLAELGVGSAIIYNLYKPLAENDKDEINHLLYIYKSLYTKIGIGISILGVILCLFIQNLIKDTNIDIFFIRVAFLIQVLSTASTYFFAYKRALFNADQKNYINVIIDTIMNIVMSLLRVITLIYTKNYILYLFIQVLQNILSNLIVSTICNKKYSYLKPKYNIEKIAQLKSDILINIKDIFISKIGSFIYFSTDNIIISTLLGVAPIGMLSNYNLLLTSVNSFIVQISNATLPSLGNFINTTDDNNKLVDIFKKNNFIIYSIGNVFFVGFIVMASSFVEVWIGDNYILDNYIIILLGINFMIDKIQTPLWQLIYVKGRFDIEKKASIIASVVNITFSIVLTIKFGLAGVLIGTIIGNIIFLVYRLRYLNDSVFKKVKYKYFTTMIRYIYITIIQIILCIVATKSIYHQVNWANIIIDVMLCMIILLTTSLIFYRRYEEYIYLKEEVIYYGIRKIRRVS